MSGETKDMDAYTKAYMEDLNKKIFGIQATKLQEMEARFAKLQADRKNAEKEALEARSAKDKLPEDVRAEIRGGITKAPFGLLLMGIEKLCVNHGDNRRLDKFIRNHMEWMRISYTSKASKEELKKLLPMVQEEIGKARDDEKDVFVLNQERDEPAFLVVIGAGGTERNQVNHKNFVFIRDGDAGGFAGENDVISLGKWMVALYCGARLGETID